MNTEQARDEVMQAFPDGEFVNTREKGRSKVGVRFFNGKEMQTNCIVIPDAYSQEQAMMAVRSVIAYAKSRCNQ